MHRNICFSFNPYVALPNSAYSFKHKIQGYDQRCVEFVVVKNHIEIGFRGEMHVTDFKNLTNNYKLCVTNLKKESIISSILHIVGISCFWFIVLRRKEILMFLHVSCLKIYNQNLFSGIYRICSMRFLLYLTTDCYNKSLFWYIVDHVINMLLDNSYWKCWKM